MTTGTRIERQGDDLYEVTFEDGSKIFGCTLDEAVAAVEERLHPDSPEPQAVSGDSGCNAAHADLDNGCSLRSKNGC